MFRFVPIFIASFFLSIHFGAILYVNSSLLGKFFTPNTVSLLFLFGAAVNIVLFLFTPKLILLFGKRFLLFLSLTLTALSTLFLALTNSAPLVILFFVIYAGFLPLSFYCLDIFLEDFSIDSKTGEIRGVYLTLINLGIALGPLTLAFLTSIEDSLTLVYLVATILLVIPVLLTFFFFKHRSSGVFEGVHHSFNLPFKNWWRDINLRRVTLARLILEFFFAIMIIYVPVYLHSQLGFQWQELGIIFTVMLLPFIIFEWPAGELADRLWGEKEMMSAGFIVTALSLAIMPFLNKVFWVWMIILFISRVGASLIEIMTESYFFKHVDSSDTGLISIFRLTRSSGIILGTIVGTLTLSLFSYEKIFLILAIVVILGLRYSLSLTDTR